MKDEILKTEKEANNLTLFYRIFYLATLGLIFLIIGGSILAITNSKDLKIKASINPAISVSPGEINFGDIRAGQSNFQEIEVKLTNPFNEAETAKAVWYLIHRFNQSKNEPDRSYCQKKSNFPDITNWKNFSNEEWQDFINSAYFDKCSFSLCPFVSIKKSSEESSENGSLLVARPLATQFDTGFLDILTENNSQNPDPALLLTESKKSDKKDYGLDSFNYPKIIDDSFKFIEAKGYLEKNSDVNDKWILTLEAPCFKNDQVCNARFKELFDKIPNELSAQNWGCAIWYEIINIER